jgi:3-oxoacyl-ACP reductase-like protein
MRRFGPLLTLLAVVVLGGALFAVNVLGNPDNQAAQPAPAASAAAPTQAAAAPTAAPAAAPTAAATPQAVAEKAYAGRSAGNEVTVAIAVKNGRAVGYICDGKKTEAWLEGTVSGSDVSLKSADGKSTIVGTVDEAKSLGTVAVGDKEWPFAAKAATAPAGLYEGRASVKGVLNRIGWIVLPDGKQVGVLQAGLTLQTAPPLDTANLGSTTLGGVPVAVRSVGGGDEVIES